MCCRLYNVGTLDVQLRAVLEESVCVILCYLHNRLMLTLCTLQHLVIACVAVACQMSYIGNVHYTLYIIADIAQVLFKHILHNVAAQISYVCKVVHGRSAGVHIYLALDIRHEFFLFV